MPPETDAHPVRFSNLGVIAVTDAQLDLDVHKAVRCDHVRVCVDRTGRVLGHQHIAAAHHGCVGHRQCVLGLSHHDLRVGVHTGAQAVGLVDAHGDRVGGGAAAGVALHGHAGHNALIGPVLHGVGGDLHGLPHRQAADLQLIHIDGHFQVAQIVDGAQVAARAQGIAHLGGLFDDGAADGRLICR